MKRLLSLCAGAGQLGLLCAASLLLPPARRREWLREWRAELWHVRRACTDGEAFSWQGEREVLAFCLGSFSDALCLRREDDSEDTHTEHADRPVRWCLLWLAAILALCVVLALLLPGVRAELDTVRYQINPDLVLIEPAVAPKQFHEWSSARQRYFDNLAFYRTARETVFTPSGRAVPWQVAHASANLFALLGLPVRHAADYADDGQDIPTVLLSQQRSERDFGGSPRSMGQVIRIGSRAVRIAGVVPYGAWRLPSGPDVSSPDASNLDSSSLGTSGPDAWLLESDAQLASEMPAAARGYVLGHLTGDGKGLVYGDGITITTYGPGGAGKEFYGTTLNGWARGPWQIWAFALFLVALALPAVTSVSMSESQFSSHRPTWKLRTSRWMFLTGKIALVAAIGCVAALDLAYGFGVSDASTAQALQFAVCFGVGLFGMRWALIDQSQRCPVCLRCVTHPAQVGHASHTFLRWSGTEMMCVGGHTLLHVPSLPTSWHGSQRWLYLDTSWEFLFGDL